MIKIKKFNEIINLDDSILLYHGSSHKITKFKSGIIFLTEDEEEAIEFGKGSHIIGQKGRPAFLYTISAKFGKTKDIQDVIDSFIMELDHPEIEDYTGDLDEFIEYIYAPKMKKEGYRYLEFSHPSFIGSGDFKVTISLYPEKDLKIFDEERV